MYLTDIMGYYTKSLERINYIGGSADFIKMVTIVV